MSLADRERARSRAMEVDLRTLARIARQLSLKATRISVEDVKLAFENSGRFLAYADRGYQSRVYGRVMQRAGLRPIVGQYRRSARVKNRGGNLNLLYARRAA